MRSISSPSSSAATRLAMSSTLRALGSGSGFGSGSGLGASLSFSLLSSSGTARRSLVKNVGVSQHEPQTANAALARHVERDGLVVRLHVEPHLLPLPRARDAVDVDGGLRRMIEEHAETERGAAGRSERRRDVELRAWRGPSGVRCIEETGETCDVERAF